MADPLERQVEQAFQPGVFIHDQMCFSFVRGPEDVVAEIGSPARLWRAQGMRIVNAGKSKYYDAALSDFESPKCCYERAGLAAEWEAVVRQVRARHSRKSGFMPGFEALAAGRHRTRQASFLERAKLRWGKRYGKERP